MTSISKPSSYFLFSVFVFIIAISISFNTETPLKSAISIIISQIYKIIGFSRVILNFNNLSASSTPDSSVPNHPVIWMAPLISDGGYYSETWSHVLEVNNTNKNDNFSLITPDSSVPKLHKAADAFNFSSRGERWGQPIVEAMAMSSPSSATFWSGPTEHMTNNNSSPQSNEFIDWPFKGHFRAEPSIKLSNEIAANIVTNHCVTWMAPFISGGGYCSEAWSYVLALNQYNKNSDFRLSVQQYGDNENGIFWEGLPLDMKKLAYKLYQTECRLNESVVIFHSEPGAWNPPLFQTTTFLPVNNRFSIGRTMFETDRVNPEHVKRCNAMDMVWVPSEFHVSSFVKSGVDPSKIVKVVQAIDTEFFDPIKYSPLDLSSIGNLVIGSGSRNAFLFLSVFKWEYRKGWDVLLQSYLKEFDSLDGVCLYLLTNPYHSDSDFGNKIVEFVKASGLKKPVNGWAPVYVIDSHIPQVEFPRLYKAADVFVLPSRGEGWGRPIVEAMAMSLPVIATNWSGPTEYLTEKNSFPLAFDRMSEVIDGPFKGHLWAEPSVDKLKFLMRHVMSNPEEAKSKGKKAREDMIDKFSPAIVANIVSDQIQRILDKLA